MNLLSIFLQAPAGGTGIANIVMIVAVLAVFYFFMIRPQQKKQKELNKLRESLAPGDKVMTAGGIYGKVKEVQQDAFVITIMDGVHIRVQKDSIYTTGDTPQA